MRSYEYNRHPDIRYGEARARGQGETTPGAHGWVPAMSRWTSAVPKSREKLLSATGLFEVAVRDARGKKLGQVEDLIIDFSRGKIEYVVFSFGGLFGVGNKLCATASNLLELDEEKKCLRLDYDKKRLRDAPEFDKHKWPYLNRTARSSPVYLLRSRPRRRAAQDRSEKVGDLKRSASQWHRRFRGVDDLLATLDHSTTRPCTSGR